MAAESIHRDFASMLDELLDEESSRRAWSGLLGSNLDYLNVMDALHSGRIVISDDKVAAGYREASGGWASEDAPAEAPGMAAPEPAHPELSVDPAEIARELGLNRGKPTGDLDQLRRRFAFANHPDRVDPALRTVAMARMQVANMLIDEAKRRQSRR